MDISTEKALAKAVDRGDQQLRITGSLAGAVSSIRSPDSVVWGGLAGTLAPLLGFAALFGVGAGAMLSFVSLPLLLTIGGGIGAAVVAVLGGKATVSAVKIGMAGNKLETLNKLRAYNEVEKESGLLVLEK